MPGGLLNLIAKGNEDVHFITNPSKTFFKCSYSKYTNFGKQKFRINPEQYSELRMNDITKLTFKFPRYAELLTDTYLIVKLPHIWSPVYKSGDHWRPYQFKWIENIGSQIIKSMKFYIGGQLIQEFTGDYLYNIVEREFSYDKKQLYYEMTGNIPELNDPANAFGRNNTYPNAFYPNTSSADTDTTDIDNYKTLGVEPSIRGRNLYIPINIWFTLLNKMALPLVSMQYVEFWVDVELRPVNQLFVVKDLDTPVATAQYIAPNPSDERYFFYRFIHNPPQYPIDGTNPTYPDKRTQWNCDIHLSSTYIFLSETEQRVFAQKPQQYLIKEIHQYIFHNIVGSSKVELNNSSRVISSWTWFFQRSDVNERNEWSNYTNWKYKTLPYNVTLPNSIYTSDSSTKHSNTPHDATNYLHTTGYYQIENHKNIMDKWALIFDGKYRENELYDGILSYVEKYKCSSGFSKDSLYTYNFCLNSSPFDYQPTGAINATVFNKIEFEFSTFTPALSNKVQDTSLCDPETGDIIGVKNPIWSIYEYNYNLTIFEERYNILTFEAGNVKLSFVK